MAEDWRNLPRYAAEAGALGEEMAVQGFIAVARIEGQFHLLAMLGKAFAVGMALILPILKASDVVLIGVGAPDGIGGVVLHLIQLHFTDQSLRSVIAV